MLFAIFIGFVVVVCAIFILIDLRTNSYKQFLLKNSVSINKLNELNNKYAFYESVKSFNEQHTYDNEHFFNDISCQDYLIYQLQFKQYDIQAEMRNIYGNSRKYSSYCKEVSEINKFGEYRKKHKLNKKRLLKLERRIFNQSILSPVIEFQISVILYCSTLNGRIYNQKGQLFSSAKIMELIKRLNNKNRGFYNDREIWDALCRVERGRVSNKMRFSIYQRDGYRCRMCGRGEREDFLEIDHIKPVSKGGKSTYDNLQTLCRRCNKNKGSDYYGDFLM
jgi:hypothetical protein